MKTYTGSTGIAPLILKLEKRGNGLLYNPAALAPGINLSYLHLLTPWSSVLLEKLIGSHLVKKFPAFYGTRTFITAFTSAYHLSLS
jgi:hypothetical protein